MCFIGLIAAMSVEAKTDFTTYPLNPLLAVLLPMSSVTSKVMLRNSEYGGLGKGTAYEREVFGFLSAS